MIRDLSHFKFRFFENVISRISKNPDTDLDPELPMTPLLDLHLKDIHWYHFTSVYGQNPKELFSRKTQNLPFFCIFQIVVHYGHKSSMCVFKKMLRTLFQKCNISTDKMIYINIGACCSKTCTTYRNPFRTVKSDILIKKVCKNLLA